jgi:hypothetical protein
VRNPAVNAPTAAPIDAPATRYPVTKAFIWYGTKFSTEPMFAVS